MTGRARYDSAQHAVYETERALWLVFREERAPWESLSATEKQEYGMRLLGMVMVDRRDARHRG